METKISYVNFSFGPGEKNPSEEDFSDESGFDDWCDDDRLDDEDTALDEEM